MNHRLSWDACGIIGAIPWIGRFEWSGQARRESERIGVVEEAWAARNEGDKEGWISSGVRAEVVWRRWVFLVGHEREDVMREVLKPQPGNTIEARLGAERPRRSELRQLLDQVIAFVFIVVLLGVLYMALMARTPGPVIVMFAVMWFFGVPAVVVRARRDRARARGRWALWEGGCPDCGYDTGSFAGELTWARLVGPARCPECGGLWPMVAPAVRRGRDFELLAEPREPLGPGEDPAAQ